MDLLKEFVLEFIYLKLQEEFFSIDFQVLLKHLLEEFMLQLI